MYDGTYMNLKTQVLKAAKSAGVLGPDGQIGRLDSLEMIELVVALEKETKIRIPPASLREESFASLDSIVALLEQVSH